MFQGLSQMCNVTVNIIDREELNTCFVFFFRSLISLLREIISGAILLPIMDVLADPVSQVPIKE